MDQAANLLIRNDKTIDAYTEKFFQYLKQCKPFMEVFTAKDTESYLDTLLEFEREDCNTLIKTESLSILTMPKETRRTRRDGSSVLEF